jgi:hypothetical protein
MTDAPDHAAVTAFAQDVIAHKPNLDGTDTGDGLWEQKDVEALARAYLDATQWRPIETAPRNRRIILAKIVGHPDHPTAFWWAVAGQWSSKFNNWNDGVEPSGLANPSHWKDIGTLPSPPEVRP